MYHQLKSVNIFSNYMYDVMEILKIEQFQVNYIYYIIKIKKNQYFMQMMYVTSLKSRVILKCFPNLALFAQMWEKKLGSGV